MATVNAFLIVSLAFAERLALTGGAVTAPVGSTGLDVDSPSPPPPQLKACEMIQNANVSIHTSGDHYRKTLLIF